MVSAIIHCKVTQPNLDLDVHVSQISHTFFDAPGAQAATFVEGNEATVASQSKPYVTMVFCGPADYKVHACCV